MSEILKLNPKLGTFQSMKDRLIVLPMPSKASDELLVGIAMRQMAKRNLGKLVCSEWVLVDMRSPDIIENESPLRGITGTFRRRMQGQIKRLEICSYRPTNRGQIPCLDYQILSRIINKLDAPDRGVGVATLVDQDKLSKTMINNKEASGLYTTDGLGYVLTKPEPVIDNIYSTQAGVLFWKELQVPPFRS